MAAFNTQSIIATTYQQNYDKKSELRAFDDTKAGVKRTVFIHPEALEQYPSDPKKTYPVVPIIDLQQQQRNSEANSRSSRDMGFLPSDQSWCSGVCLGRGARHFHEQHVDVKKPYYSRDIARKVMYNCNFYLFSEKSPAANWRDSLYCVMTPNPAKAEELPETCRDIIIEYSDHVMKFGYTMLELLSEGLGLKPNHLKELGCSEGLSILCNYYPSCPQPELAIGTSKHADNVFFTVLLQDDLGGLQVLHKNQWVDVPPAPGALLINIGDILQLLSNDKYKSIEHRVLANKIGPRISIAGFFSTGPITTSRIYGPIEELLSKDNPPKYRAITMKEYFEYTSKKGIDGNSNLDHYKII
ncbi:unnamed protein product [Withania somnifera]